MARRPGGAVLACALLAGAVACRQADEHRPAERRGAEGPPGAGCPSCPAQAGPPADRAVPREVLVQVSAPGGDVATQQRVLGKVEELLGPRRDTCSRSMSSGLYRFRLPRGLSLERALEMLPALGVPGQPNFRYFLAGKPNDSEFDADNIWTNPGEIPGNGIDDDGDGYIDDVHGLNAITAVQQGTGAISAGDPMDDAGHGTAVAGIIGARGDNGMLIAGVLWETQIVLCKSLPASGPGCTCDAVKCLDYLAHLKKDKRVNLVAVNASWGGGAEDAALRAAIKELGDDGVLFVAAAGDLGQNLDCEPYYPAAYPLPNVIAVAETDCADAITQESGCGAHSVHVAAPGYQVPSLQPTQPSLPDVTVMEYGTSMAAPHVTGLIGLLASQDVRGGNAVRDWRALRNLILAGGTQLPAAAQATISGRRLRARDPGGAGTGSMTCSAQLVRKRLRPVENHTDANGTRVHLVEKGKALELAAIAIDCASVSGPVEVVVSGNAYPGDVHVPLADNGTGADQSANDGLYAATWTPNQGPDDFTLKFFYGVSTNSTEGVEDRLTVRVVDTVSPDTDCACSVTSGNQVGASPSTGPPPARPE